MIEKEFYNVMKKFQTGLAIKTVGYFCMGVGFFIYLKNELVSYALFFIGGFLVGLGWRKIYRVLKYDTRKLEVKA
jgi:hypothetical protein